MIRRALLAAALASVAGCAMDRPASAPRSGADVEATCRTALPLIEEHEEVLGALSGTGSPSVADGIRKLRRAGEVSTEVASALSSLRIESDDLKSKAATYSRSSRVFAGMADAMARALETFAHKNADAYRDLAEAARGIESACERKPSPVECPSILVAMRPAEASGWQDDAQLEKMLLGLSSVETRNREVRAEVNRIADRAGVLLPALRDLSAQVAAEKERVSSEGPSLAVAQDALLGACGKPNAHPARGEGADSKEWVHGSDVDVRKLTVVVKVHPPGHIPALFESYAEGKSEDVASFYRASARGGFGSGFVLVRRGAERPRVFVVTNRHVVDMADKAEIVLDDGESFPRAEILYIDPRYDLAVLGFDPEGTPPPFTRGFALDTREVKDGQAVVATGYPGLGASPSYQTAKGYVSNERFVLDEDGGKRPHIQHTAPIDRGSSGGPLTNESGALLGVNTFKVNGRESIAFAVPASAVATAVRKASLLDACRASADCLRRMAKEGCLDVVAELSARRSDTAALDRLVSTRLVERAGVTSYNAFVDDDTRLQALFREEPLEALRYATLEYLTRGLSRAGGISALEVCANSTGGPDAGGDGRAPDARFDLALTGGGAATLTLHWEHGRYTLAGLELPATSSQARGAAVLPARPPTSSRARSAPAKR